MALPARLVSRFGPSRQTYELPARTLTIGRDPVNDVSIPDAEVSRHHARVVFDQGRYIIEDLGSTNGTFVNGVQITGPTQLSDGATVDFGETQRYTFLMPQMDDAAATLLDAATSEGPGAPEGQPPPIFAPQWDVPRPIGEPAPPTLLDPVAPRREAAPHEEAPQRPPLAPTIDSLPPVPPAEPEKRGWRGRALFGCGCALVLIALVIVATLFVLDAVAPDLLYCGALRSLAEAAAQATGQVVACP